MGNKFLGKDKDQRYFDEAYSLENDQQTKAHYAKWAQVYDLEIGEEKGYRQPERCAAALLAAGVEKDARILDIGCGTGLSGIAIKSAGYKRIDGCDFSPEMLEKARGADCYQRLFEADLNRPPLDVETDHYHAITCVGVFSFGHIDPQSLDEVLRLLRPGGTLVIGINDRYYAEGDFRTKLDQLENSGAITITAREHGIHLENVEGSTGWVIVGEKM